MNPHISLIIVSWNVHEQLKANLKRLFELKTEHSLEVIVVDNGSEDGSPKMIRESFSDVHLVQNDVNRGFAFACNQGLSLARGQILILFNPDMLMGEKVLDQTYYVLMQNTQIGVMGVKLLRPDGSVVPSVRRNPAFPDQLAVLLKLPHLFPRLVAHYLAKDFDYHVSQNVEQIRGSFFAFRRDVMEKTGLLDAKNFFVWFEEVDYCRRVREAGYQIWYDATVACTDLVGQAFKQQSIRVKQARLSLSMARYFAKWHSKWQAAVIYALRPFVILAGGAADFLRLRSSLWK